MAGLSKDAETVDVVAAVADLVPVRQPPEPEPPAEPTSALDLAAAGPVSAAALCPFGHENAPHTTFCGTCGLRMDAAAGKADLNEARPRPEHELDAAERAERQRQHAEAQAAAARFENAAEVIVPASGQTLLIHFVEDGLTAFGRVWLRGQELEIGPDHPRWADAVGWITMSKAGQFERWGKQYFDHGPWPGIRSYTAAAGAFEKVTVNGPDGTRVEYHGPSEEELRRADAMEARRGRGVPAASFR